MALVVVDCVVGMPLLVVPVTNSVSVLLVVVEDRAPMLLVVVLIVAVEEAKPVLVALHVDSKFVSAAVVVAVPCTSTATGCEKAVTEKE